MARRTLIDHAYRLRIRAKPCAIAVALGRVDECEGAVEACHDKHSGMGGKDVPDHYNLWPGCREHHDEDHNGRQSMEEKYGFGVTEVCQQLGREILDGLDFFDKPWGVEIAHL